jgi:hypothetical protein
MAFFSKCALCDFSSLICLSVCVLQVQNYSCEFKELQIWGCIQKFPEWVDNELNNNNNNNKHSLRSNTKAYGGNTHWTDSQNGDINAPSGR